VLYVWELELGMCDNVPVGRNAISMLASRSSETLGERTHTKLSLTDSQSPPLNFLILLRQKRDISKGKGENILNKQV